MPDKVEQTSFKIYSNIGPSRKYEELPGSEIEDDTEAGEEVGTVSVGNGDFNVSTDTDTGS